MRNLREEAGRFDERAHGYDRGLKQRWFFRPVHRRILETLALRSGERFLEVGCGTGNLALAAAGITGSAIGVDPAPKMIAVARSKRPPARARVEFLVGAAESLPFPDAAFDAAASSISMHHWVDPAAGLREIRRVLRPGGRAVVADVGTRGVGRPAAFLSGLTLPGHARPWVPEELARVVQRAGFVRVRLLRRGAMSRIVAFVAAETEGA